MGQLSFWHAQQSEALRQIDLLGDSMVREMARLEAQIARLEANLADVNLTESVAPPDHAAPETQRESPRNFPQAA